MYNIFLKGPSGLSEVRAKEERYEPEPNKGVIGVGVHMADGSTEIKQFVVTNYSKERPG